MVLGFEGNSVWINAKNRTLKCAARRIRHATPDEMLPRHEIFDETYAADSAKPVVSDTSEHRPEAAGPPSPMDTDGAPEAGDDHRAKPQSAQDSYVDFTIGSRIIEFSWKSTTLFEKNRVRHKCFATSRKRR